MYIILINYFTKRDAPKDLNKNFLASLKRSKLTLVGASKLATNI